MLETNKRSIILDVGLAPRPSNAGNHPGLAPTSSGEKERKMGHRRVDETGQVSYKKMPTNQLMGSIQLGIQYSIGAMSRQGKKESRVRLTHHNGSGLNSFRRVL